MALTREEQTRYDIAKWRWRAGVLEYDADLYDQIGKSQIAADKREQANALRAEADAVERWSSIVDEHGGNSPEGIAASEVLRAFRAEHRTEPVEVATLDGYNEPTAAELGVI